MVWIQYLRRYDINKLFFLISFGCSICVVNNNTYLSRHSPSRHQRIDVSSTSSFLYPSPQSLSLLRYRHHKKLTRYSRETHQWCIVSWVTSVSLNIVWWDQPLLLMNDSRHTSLLHWTFSPHSCWYLVTRMSQIMYHSTLVVVIHFTSCSKNSMHRSLTGRYFGLLISWGNPSSE